MAKVSPISLALGNKQLPDLFALQFCHSVAEPFSVRLSGKLHEVWYRPRFIFPILWLLEKFGVLISEKGKMIPTTLVVTAATDPKGNPIQLWERRFHGKKVRKFDVKVVFDPVSKRAIDLVGLGKFLALGWNIRVEGNKLHIDVVQAGIRFGRRFVWLPNVVWPLLLGRETFEQEIIDADAKLLRINLNIRHPLFGDVFGYNGEFTIERCH